MKQTRKREYQDGLSLIELLVAMTILAMATVISLMIYDGARRSYKLGENVAAQQQAVRIAFDLMSSDLRSAGYNVNPDGNRSRPDEQIEAAAATAVVIRADFDAADPVAAATPEATLAGGAFLSVTTGNDEIRAYVLAKPDGTSSESLDFQADVGQPVRDGVVESVSVGNVDLLQNDPPYTLYRVTLDDSAGIVRTPLIENVRSLRFRYFDRAGQEILPVGGADLPADKSTRAAIRRVSVELEGLTRDPDPNPRWVDPTDSDPDTRQLRKFLLAGDVTPRNLGMVGVKDYQSDSVPPLQPVSPPQVFTGHCDGLLVSWAPNPPEDEVAYYRVRYEDPWFNEDWHASTKTYCYIGGLLNGEAYSVSIQAVDAAGNASALSNSALATTANVLPSNVPLAPTSPVASLTENGRVDLSWDAVTENFGATTGDIESPRVRDLAGYRVYRGTTSGFPADSAHRIADADLAPNLPSPGFSDRTAVNCRPYFYRIAAVDRCQAQSALSDEITGMADSDVAIQRPTDTQAFFSSTGVRVKWQAPHEDVAGDPITVEDFRVYRTAPLPDTTDPTTLGDVDFNLLATLSGVYAYDDASIVLLAGQSAWYRVVAFDACSPPNESLPTDPVAPSCAFTGDVEIQAPPYGSHVWGSTGIDVVVVGGLGTYTETRLTFTHESSGASTQYTLPVVSNVSSHTWDAQPGVMPPDFFLEGSWHVAAEVDRLIGLGPSVCTASASTKLIVDSGS